jgi:hypothetical protein
MPLRVQDDAMTPHELPQVVITYRHDRRTGRRTVLIREGARGPTLRSIDAPDAVRALRAAARALAWCERQGWRVTRIQPFPWVDEVIVHRANDGPSEPAQAHPTHRRDRALPKRTRG